jgi:hypothetical protein
MVNMTAFCDVEPCSLVEVNRRFRSAFFLHQHGDTSVTSVYFTALYARRLSPSYSPPWEPKIAHLQGIKNTYTPVRTNVAVPTRPSWCFWLVCHMTAWPWPLPPFTQLCRVVTVSSPWEMYLCHYRFTGTFESPCIMGCVSPSPCSQDDTPGPCPEITEQFRLHHL